MARDEQIDIVIRIFTHRFISSGVPLADFQQATDGIERWEDWLPRWSARAEIHEKLGRDALEAGHTVSAGEHLTTAAACAELGGTGARTCTSDTCFASPATISHC